MVLHKHYCGGQLEECSIFVGKTCCCGTEIPSDCCSGEKEIFQFDEDALASGFEIVTHKTIQAQLDFEPTLRAFRITSQLRFPPQHSPPRVPTDILIQLQRFRL